MREGTYLRDTMVHVHSVPVHSYMHPKNTTILTQICDVPYSRKYWQELNLAVGFQIAIAIGRKDRDRDRFACLGGYLSIVCALVE